MAPAKLKRTNQSENVWRSDLGSFVSSPAARRRGLVIEYLYEPDRTVPQRLYRYDVYKDYLVRLRDEFEFGFELICEARVITGPTTYGVYVIQIGDDANHVYVGQSWYLPEERLRQHLTGYAAFHAAKPFKRRVGPSKLRHDLYGNLPRFATQAESEEVEAELAYLLAGRGFRVEGGH